jgi:sugar lactone lactonase YvrE
VRVQLETLSSSQYLCPHSNPSKAAVGSLFLFSSSPSSPALTRTTIRTSLIIPNGIGWSLDRTTLYFTHSTAKHILAFDYPSLANERVFWSHSGDGDPDGFKMDAEGNIWQAIYGEGRVLRISPAGEVVGEVRYPAKCITCPVFVGTELWVTSADEGKEEFGGGVFRVDVGVGGLEDFKFKLGGVQTL